MRNLMISVGQYQFYDEPCNKGLVGGKIIVINPDTGEEISQSYKKFHTGKTDKFNVLAQLMYKVAPPQTEKSDNEDSSKETYAAEDMSKGNI